MQITSVMLSLASLGLNVLPVQAGPIPGAEAALAARHVYSPDVDESPVAKRHVYSVDK
ncbi:hypothetical protein CSAL01_12851, partial [Colletotrichum salicis]